MRNEPDQQGRRAPESLYGASKMWATLSGWVSGGPGQVVLDLAQGLGGYRTGADGWTVRTADGSRAAHSEHTVAVTDDGPQVLTS